MNALRRIGFVEIGRLLHPRFKRGIACAGHGVGARIGVLPAFGQKLLIAHRGEEVEHALAGKTGTLEEGGTRLVRARFLLAGEGEQAARCKMLAAHDERHACIACARGNGTDTKDHGCHDRHRQVLEFLAPLHEMAARHMADFVGDNAHELARRIHRGDEAGMEEHLLAAGDEGVEIAVVDEMDLDRGRVDAGRAQQRVRIFAQHRFGFGIADDADALRLGRDGQQSA